MSHARRRAKLAAAVTLATMVLASVAERATADYADLVQSLDPIAYWRFNDPSSAEGAAAADSSPAGGHGGAYHNGVTFTADVPGPGSGGQAAAFDGVNAYVGNIDDAGFPAGDADRTFTAWFRYPTSHPFGNGTFFRYGMLNWHSMFGVGVMNSNDINVPNPAVGVSQIGTAVGTDPILDEQWHFLAVTCSGSNYRVYLDGQFIRERWMLTDTLLTSAAFISQPGPDAWGRGVPLQGCLDEMALFGTVLTDRNIRDLYDEMAVPEPAALLLLALGGVGLARRRRGRPGRS